MLFRSHTWLEMMNLLVGVSAPDDHTFVIELSEPYYPLLTELGVTRPFAMISPAAMKDGSTMNAVSYTHLVIYGAKTAAPEVKYTFLEQSFGALSAIAICAGSVMGLPLLISDYRQKKILKRYKVTPASPAFLLAVWVTIYAVYSLLSLGLVFGVLSIFFGCRFGGSTGIFLFMYLLVMCSMFSIGLMVGGVAPDTKTASVAASLLYFPMLIFSGATLPLSLIHI